MMNIFKKNLKESMSKQCFEENASVLQEQESVRTVNEQQCEETASVTHEQEKFSAQKALELASSKWVAPQNEEIIEDIKRYAGRGERRVSFFESIITEEQILWLEEMGFQVTVGEMRDKTPYFKVSW